MSGPTILLQAAGFGASAAAGALLSTHLGVSPEKGAAYGAAAWFGFILIFLGPFFAWREKEKEAGLLRNRLAPRLGISGVRVRLNDEVATLCVVVSGLGSGRAKGAYGKIIRATHLVADGGEVAIYDEPCWCLWSTAKSGDITITGGEAHWLQIAHAGTRGQAIEDAKLAALPIFLADYAEASCRAIGLILANTYRIHLSIGAEDMAPLAAVVEVTLTETSSNKMSAKLISGGG